jgi:hypothetical protein
VLRPASLLTPLLALFVLACDDTKDTTTETGILPGLSDEDGDGYSDAEDCDDNDATVNPGAEERCDGLDNDCDGEVDQDATDAATFYADGDGDGYGAGAATTACEPPEGFVSQDGDCDDSDSAFFPGATETDCADPNDYNCDGSVGFEDNDADGFPACLECDDSARAVNPLAVEVCDEIDNNCDGQIDADAVDTTRYHQDVDGDGFGDPDFFTDTCDAPEGYTEDDGDCDDSRAEVNPDAEELCDELDNDCDGEIDPPSAVDAQTWYGDGDGDGVGVARLAVVACVAPDGFVATTEDCDDGDGSAYPGATEVCDEVDNDCDGETDEGVQTGWYADLDEDGYGQDATALMACEAPTDLYVATGGDCDDSADDVNPGESAGCDGLDHDCDGLIDNDDDLDGYADETCGGDDCDDSDGAITPEVDGACALGADCLSILSAGLSTGDGTYTIDPDGSGVGADPFEVECDMTTDGGGWTQLADEDYTVEGCPGAWLKSSSSGYCHRGTARGSAASAEFDSFGITYSEVFGALTGYQYASMNGFWYTSGRTIDDFYVDGISITHGLSGARTHIWTYAVGMTYTGRFAYDCPDRGGTAAPSFVGANYTCDTGNLSSTTWAYQWYSTAAFANEGFQRTLSSPTDDAIEVRLIADEESSAHTYSEDVGVSAIELWVR